ncbi:hypothetical protein BCR42DRAFT_425330 [Absidia repens]|uniref:Uncharacterized protein n=1 Tax=Absidia repens TaxID=90262 RepID=A0A1X2I318_9FUNG|nr:hypothetical protein BCR42DRAFT_425330 [Absidia repens]
MYVHIVGFLAVALWNYFMHYFFVKYELDGTMGSELWFPLGFLALEVAELVLLFPWAFGFKSGGGPFSPLGFCGFRSGGVGPSIPLGFWL